MHSSSLSTRNSSTTLALTLSPSLAFLVLPEDGSLTTRGVAVPPFAAGRAKAMAGSALPGLPAPRPRPPSSSLRRA